MNLFQGRKNSPENLYGNKIEQTFFMISVRIALPEDFEVVSALGRRAFYEAFGEYNKPEDMQAYLDLSFNPEAIKQQLEDPEIIFFIATYQDDPGGYAKLKRNSAPPELE